MTKQEIKNDLLATYDKLYLNKVEASKALDISVSTLQNYMRDGHIESTLRGNKRYFSVDAVALAIRDGIDATGVKKKTLIEQIELADEKELKKLRTHIQTASIIKKKKKRLLALIESKL